MKTDGRLGEGTSSTFPARYELSEMNIEYGGSPIFVEYLSDSLINYILLAIRV